MTYSVYDRGQDLIIMNTLDEDQSPDMETQSNAHVEFRVSHDNDSISGTFEDVSGRRSFSGKRTAVFEDYLGTASTTDTVGPLEGVFTGLVLNKPAILSIRRKNRGYIGTIVFDQGTSYRVEITMNVYHGSTSRGLIYLTNRDTGNGRFVQLRGHITDSAFIGQYIIGGRSNAQTAKMRRTQ